MNVAHRSLMRIGSSVLTHLRCQSTLFNYLAQGIPNILTISNNTAGDLW